MDEDKETSQRDCSKITAQFQDANTILSKLLHGSTCNEQHEYESEAT